MSAHSPHRQEPAVSLRPLAAGDAKIVYEWQSNPRTRQYFRNPALPSWEEHCAWIGKILADPERHPYIILSEGQPAGFTRLDKRPEEKAYEVSILLDPACYGKGIAAAALQQVEEKHPDLTLWAQIMASNEASLKLFTAAGYRPVKDNWYRKTPGHD